MPLVALAPDDEGTRIDEDLVQARVVVVGAVEQQQASLGGDRDPHLVGDGEAVAADEGLLGEEDLDVPAELALQLRRQPAVKGHVPAQDRAPRRREGPVADAPAAQRGEPRLQQSHAATSRMTPTTTKKYIALPGKSVSRDQVGGAGASFKGGALAGETAKGENPGDVDQGDRGPC